MQEFTWPGRTAETELAFDLEKAALRREFEQRLEECGTLAFRVACGVLRNVADAEDVAQEAILRSYRRFARLRIRRGSGHGSFESPSVSRSIMSARHADANTGKQHGRTASRRRPRRTSLRRTNSGGAYNKRWRRYQKNHGSFWYSPVSMVTRSKRWQSYYSCQSGP